MSQSQSQVFNHVVPLSLMRRMKLFALSSPFIVVGGMGAVVTFQIFWSCKRRLSVTLILSVSISRTRWWKIWCKMFVVSLLVVLLGRRRHNLKKYKVVILISSFEIQMGKIYNEKNFAINLIAIKSTRYTTQNLLVYIVSLVLLVFMSFLLNVFNFPWCHFSHPNRTVLSRRAATIAAEKLATWKLLQHHNTTKLSSARLDESEKHHR